MISSLSLSDFIASPGAILDVRSPGEFSQGCIPGALNFPLFSDAERAQVGTTYKQMGRQQAIDLGLRLVGPKLADFAERGREYATDGCVRVHCWRGGMRSASMAWLLQTAGLHAVTLQGGYKTFRRWALESFSRQVSLIVVGGLTGAGKTAILHALRELGEQVIDLEGLAHHRGSSYGMFGMPPQPSTEQFENLLAMELGRCDPLRPIWVEDESHLVGTCKIPDLFFAQMRQSPLFVIERPLEERLSILLHDYGKIDPLHLMQATKRLSKRLGAVRTHEVLEHIEAGRLREAVVEILRYYDAAYLQGLTKRQQPMHSLVHGELSFREWAMQLRTLRNKRW